MRILFIEDDKFQAEWILELFSEEIPGAQIERHTFVFDFEKWLAGPSPAADLVILDVMVINELPDSRSDNRTIGDAEGWFIGAFNV